MAESPSSSSAFLSVRLAKASRDRLKAAASARGASVQGLVGDLVERFLADEARAAPQLTLVLAALRVHAEELARRGVSALWVFGSVARGDARVGSDIDLMAEFDGEARVSVVGLASLRAWLTEVLGAPADLVERPGLHAAVREQAERDAVRVL